MAICLLLNPEPWDWEPYLDPGGSGSEVLAGGWESGGTYRTHLLTMQQDLPQRDVDHLEILAAGGGGDLAGACADIVHNRVLKSRPKKVKIN